MRRSLLHGNREISIAVPASRGREIVGKAGGRSRRLERHYVNNWSARLDFALLSKIILAARNADERTYAA